METNKKGFTLVELLAIVIILSIIIIIVVTNGFGAFNSAKQSIITFNEKAIAEASRIFLDGVNDCDTLTISDRDELLSSQMYDNQSYSLCNDLLAALENTSVKLNVEGLIENGYVKGSDLNDKSIYNKDNVKIEAGMHDGEIEVWVSTNAFVKDDKSLASKLVGESFKNYDYTSQEVSSSEVNSGEYYTSDEWYYDEWYPSIEYSSSEYSSSEYTSSEYNRYYYHYYASEEVRPWTTSELTTREVYIPSYTNENYRKSSITSRPSSNPGELLNYNEAELVQYDEGGNRYYYYRGNVQDNYVLFNNTLFRILRINPDGSVRAIMEGEQFVSKNNMASDNHYDNLSSSNKKYLVKGDLCTDNNITSYTTYEYGYSSDESGTSREIFNYNSGTPRLNCSNSIKRYINYPSVNELLFAGASWDYNYYPSFIKANALTTANNSYVSIVYNPYGNRLQKYYGDMNHSSYIVTFSSKVKFLTGKGTKYNPYKLKL